LSLEPSRKCAKRRQYCEENFYRIETCGFAQAVLANKLRFSCSELHAHTSNNISPFFMNCYFNEASFSNVKCYIGSFRTCSLRLTGHVQC
jgi:uncharacterized protein YjbI with pentapeptide repeats